MDKQELAHIVIDRLKNEYPDADCTLDYNEAWKLLVSVRLAAQCTDERVNTIVKDLFAKYPGIKERSPVKAVIRIWRRTERPADIPRETFPTV